MLLFFEKFFKNRKEKTMATNINTKIPESIWKPGGGGVSGGGGGGFPGAEKPTKPANTKSIVRYLFGVKFMR